MVSDRYTLRGIWTAALTGAVFIAIGCGFQAAAAPTVRVSCPARTAAAPDCDLRWLVAFDMVPVRFTPLPALQSAEIVETARSRSGAATTLYLNTADGPVDDHVGRSSVTAARSPGSPSRIPRQRRGPGDRVDDVAEQVGGSGRHRG